MKFLYFGNCQMEAFARIHRTFFTKDTVESLQTHKHTNLDIALAHYLDKLQPDYLIHQPPGKALREQFPRLVPLLNTHNFPITIAPLINTALWPFYPDGSRLIYGEHIKKQCANAVHAEHRMARGSLVFEFSTRWERTLAELRWRESRTDIKMADVIQENFQGHRLFYTQNHPTMLVMMEAFNRLCAHWRPEGNPNLFLETLSETSSKFLYDTDLEWPHTLYEKTALGLAWCDATTHCTSWHRNEIKKLFSDGVHGPKMYTGILR